jgi:class 3 adenylate cyclase/CheY-like chemotaxis protein
LRAGVADDRKTVLVVDDSDLVAAMIARVLDEAGFRTVRARDGVEGVRMAYTEMPDLILMDVEMPLLQGYQASRLLKHRRGVCEIPIIMHTSHTEDRDKYWALSSGADAFASKDFDNLDGLVAQVRALSAHPPYDPAAMGDDAALATRDRILEMVGVIFDEQLFQSTIFNLLGEVGRSMSSLTDTARKVLDLLPKVCLCEVATLLLRYGKRVLVFLRPGVAVRRQEMEEFLSVCLGDFHPHFPAMDLEAAERVWLDPERRADPDTASGGRRLGSYAVFPLEGKGNAVIGTLHLGSLTNNYFSERIRENVAVFASGAATVIENSILFNQVSEMQDRVRTVFAKFVPQEIIDDLVEKRSDAERLVGEKRVVAVLFSDIRSFATISEDNSAEKVVAFLNGYFDVMVDVIRRHGGTVDKFIGDAILAIFGAPRSYEDNARRAVLAAAEMMSSVPSVRVDGLVLPPEGLQTGVGIHQGPVIVGNIGSADKFNYTVVGDTVNLASRLEGLTKHYRRNIIVSEVVREEAADAAFYRLLDTVRVKGKGAATRIYAVETDTARYTDAFMDPYDKAMKMYAMGNWITALEYFRKAATAQPDDPVTRLFLDRCAEYRDQPPEHWDGAQDLDFK